MVKKTDIFPDTPVEETETTATTSTSVDVLESAWDVLSKALTKHVNDAVSFHAQLLHIPKWQLVCGLIVQAWKMGSLTAPDLDPSWQAGGVVQRESQKCPECGKYFIPENRGMEFCSDKCGKADMHKKWKARFDESERIRRSADRDNVGLEDDDVE